jgi:hypothetical protein
VGRGGDGWSPAPALIGSRLSELDRRWAGSAQVSSRPDGQADPATLRRREREGALLVPSVRQQGGDRIATLELGSSERVRPPQVRRSAPEGRIGASPAGLASTGERSQRSLGRRLVENQAGGPLWPRPGETWASARTPRPGDPAEALHPAGAGERILNTATPTLRLGPTFALAGIAGVQADAPRAASAVAGAIDAGEAPIAREGAAPRAASLSASGDVPRVDSAGRLVGGQVCARVAVSPFDVAERASGRATTLPQTAGAGADRDPARAASMAFLGVEPAPNATRRGLPAARGRRAAHKTEGRAGGTD